MSIKKLATVLAASVISVTAVTVAAFAENPKGISDAPRYFPDKDFRKYVMENYDLDGNGFLSIKEREAVTVIDLTEKRVEHDGYVTIYKVNVSSLKGIEYFPNLNELYCSNQDYLKKALLW